MTPIEVTVTFKVNDEPTGRRVAHGWDIDVPGLAIAESNEPGIWGLIHVSSGLVITSRFTSPEGAFGLAQALADVDWTRTAVDLNDDPHVWDTVRAAAKRYRPDVERHWLITRHDLEMMS